jgi:uncharacterized protein YyaL (SSP411 family)
MKTALLLTSLLALSAPHGAAPDWQPWSKATFDAARQGERIIVVHVGTQWCHWCHVMDEKTWADPAVLKLLGEGFTMIRVDADERPDLGERYQDWGWPALVFLTPDAKPIRNLKGYRSPKKMRAILEDLARKKAKGETLAVKDAARRTPPAALSDARALAEAQLDADYDEKMGAWGGPKKYPRKDPVAYALLRAARYGQAEWLARARFTLDQQIKITDPVWGGMYQYSTRGDWDHPHTEKLAFMQAWTLSMYADGFRATGDAKHLEVARGTFRYVRDFLTDEHGAFYANQDADLGTRGGEKMKGPEFYALDDKARRALGVPWIDERVYAEHNGHLIAGLADLYRVSGDDEVRALAEAAAARVLKTHRAGELLVHEAPAKSGKRFLIDQVAMGEATLALFDATGDARWLDESQRLALATRDALFDGERGLFLANTREADEVLAPRTPFQLNARAARWFHRLSLHSDRPALKPLKAQAERALTSLSRPGWIKKQGRAVGGYLLAVDELLEEPLHIAVVAKDRGAARALYAAALKQHAPGRVVEYLKPGGRFPDLGKPTAFVCGASFCSRPLKDEASLAKTVQAFLKVKR